jgi:hypothetical protein
LRAAILRGCEFEKYFAPARSGNALRDCADAQPMRTPRGGERPDSPSRRKKPQRFGCGLANYCPFR